MRGGTSPTTLRAASETAPSRYSPRHKKNLETGREHTVVLVPPAYCGTGRPSTSCRLPARELAEERWIDWWTRLKAAHAYSKAELFRDWGFTAIVL